MRSLGKQIGDDNIDNDIAISSPLGDSSNQRLHYQTAFADTRYSMQMHPQIACDDEQLTILRENNTCPGHAV
jgi:hypothetical protein